MDRKLHLLETFQAQGSDGVTYKVMAYEHMARDESFADAQDRWEPTGVAEYRLASGERVDMATDGSLCVANTGVRLQRPETHA